MSYEIKPNAMRTRKIIFEGFYWINLVRAVYSDDNKMLIVPDMCDIEKMVRKNAKVSEMLCERQ